MFQEGLLYQDLTGGINSKQRANKIGANELVSILGFDFDANTLRRAKGYTKFGTESDTSLTGKTLYTHNMSVGTDIMVKTVGTFVKFYDSVDDAWYKLTTATFTTGLRWAFDSAYGYLYGNNGTDTWILWNSNATTTLNGAVLAGAITIDLTDATNLPASGTIMCQDEIISYTGKAANQLTGVTGVLVNHASGSTVVQTLDSSTYTGLEKAKDIAIHQNRMYYISSTNRTKILFSKLADNTNPETDLLNFTVGGTTGDAGYNFAPDEMVAIQEYINGNNSSILMVFCKNGTAYAFSVTDGASTTTSVFIPARTMNSYPINRQSVAIAENDLAIIDQYNHVRTLGYGDVNTPVKTSTISFKIEPSLEATDFSDSCFVYHNRKLYVGGATITGGTNDIYYYHDSNYTAWGAYSHWDVVDFTEYNSELYGLSAVTGDVWKLNDGYSVYTNDSSENNEGDYYSEAVTRIDEWEAPFTYKELYCLRLTGFITSLAEVYLDVYFDGVLFSTFLISGDNTDILGSIPNVAVGTVVFGQGVFGGGLPNGSVRKDFVAQLSFNAQKKFLGAQFRFRMTGKNVDFEVNDMGAWAKATGNNYWLEAKIIKPS